ncbi:MAG: flippase-like domain-containing protein [bacterium]|nr:flippase-like domain-containing protein [bacterium]
MEKTLDLKKIVINILVPVLITIGVIYLFFRDISPGDIKENFLRISFAYLMVFVILSLLGTVLRAVKYHVLLSKKLSFKDIFLITLVRNFSVDLLPARSAALIFYSWLTRKKGISIEEGASSFVVSVFYDGLALCFMLGGLIFFLDTGINRLAIYIGMGVIFFISVVMIFFADGILGFVLGWKILQRFSRLEGKLKSIHEYLCQHKSNGERLYVFGLSLVIRVIKYLFVFVLFDGVVRVGFGLHAFSVFSFGLAGTEMSSLIPIQGIGGFGTWELAFAYIFKALQVPANNLKEAGFVIHITTQVWEYFIGILAFLFIYMKKSPKKESA